MFLKGLFENREKVKTIAHFIAGLAILIHAYIHFVIGHHKYILFLFTGPLFLINAILHLGLKKKPHGMTVSFFCN